MGGLSGNLSLEGCTNAASIANEVPEAPLSRLDRKMQGTFS